MPIRNSTAPSETEDTPSRKFFWRKAGIYLLAYAVLFVLLASKSVPCVFANTFHAPCPGCGSTRAVIALATGNVDAFLHANPFGVPTAIFMGALAVDSLRSALFHGHFGGMDKRLGRIVLRGVVVVAVLEFALWIARFFGAFGGPVPV